MRKTIRASYGWVLVLCVVTACKVPALVSHEARTTQPASYQQGTDTTNAAAMNWQQFFGDAYLAALIDTALHHNQELQITLQEIAMSQNEINARRGEYLPFVGIGAGMGAEKEGRYTRHGAVDESIEMKPGKPIPKILPDLSVGLQASWELDIWKKLRNGRKSAVLKYLSSQAGKNFMITNLVAEIAASYYELIAQDNLLDILQRNITLQTSALQVIRMEKTAAKVTQLAVNRFEAQLLNTQNLQYAIRQRITETENRINFLLGRFPQPVQRDAAAFTRIDTTAVAAGIPSQLLYQRPDIQQAELMLQAAKLDVSMARADFYPSFRLTAGIGLRAFNPAYLVNPESILYNLAGDMIAPLINKRGIRAAYLNANARQVQAVYTYEQSILRAHVEVVNQLNRAGNAGKSYATKAQEAAILDQSVSISNNLFRSAHADYMEVLLTQREALEARIDLTEIQLEQALARVSLYRALGGGWK